MTEFERVWPLLEKALAVYGNTHSKDDLRSLIERGQASLWPMENSAFVTEIVRYPKLTAINTWLAGGDMAELMTWRPFIEEWAKERGVNRVTLRAREGWERVLRDHGYRRLAVELIKDL